MHSDGDGADDLLEWWNDQFESSHATLSGLSDGVAYLQLVDALYPQAVSLADLDMAPATTAARARNVAEVVASLKRAGIRVPPGISAEALVSGSEKAHATLASALREHAEASAERMDTLASYPARQRRLQAVPQEPRGGPRPSGALPGSGPFAGPSERGAELKRLEGFMRAELARRLRAVEAAQLRFYDLRHERDLLHDALRRIEAVCGRALAEEDEETAVLAGDLLQIVTEVPPDFEPVEPEEVGPRARGSAEAGLRPAGRAVHGAGPHDAASRPLTPDAAHRSSLQVPLQGFSPGSGIVTPEPLDLRVQRSHPQSQLADDRD